MAEFPIVGIGSSAGGLEALQALFRAMPADSGIGFVVAAHRPDPESHLSELLSRCTTMPVVQIENSMQVEPNRVYVIAPDQELTIRKGVLHSEKPRAQRGHRHPVDVFLRSLADDQGERAIAIILSGTGANGSLAVRFIKAEGGVVLVQDPETAGFQGMPRSAIGTGVVDLVLPPEKMAGALVSMARHPYVGQPPEAGERTTPDDQLQTLLALVHGQTKQDFDPYRKRTLLRRIHRRMGLHRIDSLPAYIRRVRADPAEAEALAADLTINVTGFFRDPEAWRVLDEMVIAPLVQERLSGSAIRVWTPGCSTGEEAYSIAMLIFERAEALRKTFDLKLFATDVARGVLSSARAGAYPASIAQDVPPEKLDRWFEMADDTYVVRRELREAITFAPQNILQDPPFSRLDLISCRNFLIYIEPDVQKRVLGLFHFALREGGHLFLGPAETISGGESLFESVSRTWRIYRRLGPTRHDVVDFPLIGSSGGSPDELQASNEELETSKEELQSLNEELNTVNNQLQAKITELEARTDDLNNLLNSTDIATLFLDRSLCIRWFTPAMKALLELLQTDIGRPIAHCAQKFNGGDLLEDAKKVLERLLPSEAEVVDRLGRWYIQRILPYRTAADRIDGVVVTFTDITDRKHLEERAEAEKEFAESIVDAVREPLLVLTPDLRIRSANESFYRDFHVRREETEGRLVYELGNQQWDIPELRRLLEEVLPHDKQLNDFRVEHEIEAIGRRSMLLNARRLNHVDVILLAIEDVTERERAEGAVRASEQRLRKVLATDAVGVLFFDKAGTLIDANDFFLSVTGYSRREVHARELTWRALTPPEWIEVSEEQLQRLETSGRIGPYEKEYFLKDGSRSWMLFVGADLGDGTTVEFCMDISDRKRAEEERDLLTRELSHRVKNTLAVVQSLAMHTNGRMRSVEAYRKAFVGRLQALARAHDLLLETRWQGADLKVLVEHAVAAYRVDHPEVVEIEGRSLRVTAKQALGLNLVLHELGTNAAKYGALSRSEGRLRVSWQIEHASGRRVRLRWQERHGPRVEPPGEKGFGMRLIERACAYELQGAVELNYAPEGLSCELGFPLR